MIVISLHMSSKYICMDVKHPLYEAWSDKTGLIKEWRNDGFKNSVCVVAHQWLKLHLQNFHMFYTNSFPS